MSYSRILIATDLSEAAMVAARVAIRFGNERTRYRVVHVLPPPLAHEFFPDEPDAAMTRQRRAAALPGLADRAEDVGLKRADTDVLVGSASREIVKEASAFLAQLVVVGNRGRADAPGKPLGRTARSIVRTSPCDVLVVREDVPGDARPHLRRILVATDFRPPSAIAAERAAVLAKDHNSDLEIVHVFDAVTWKENVSLLLHETQPDQAWINERYDTMLETFARQHLHSDAHTALLTGRPGPAIAEHAKASGADLVVVGTHGEGDGGSFGSNAETITELCPRNVIIAR